MRITFNKPKLNCSEFSLYIVFGILFSWFGSENGSEIIAVLHLAFIIFSVIGFSLYVSGKTKVQEDSKYV